MSPRRSSLRRPGRSSTCRPVAARPAGGVLQRAAQVTVLVTLGLLAAACGPQEGALTSLAVGDCFDDPAATVDLTAVPVVPCEEPHRYEVVGTELVPDRALPGVDLGELALEACADRFAAYVGVRPEASELRSAVLVPTPGGWEDGDREALCLATDPEVSLVGSVAGAAR